MNGDFYLVKIRSDPEPGVRGSDSEPVFLLKGPIRIHFTGRSDPDPQPWYYVQEVVTHFT